MKRLLAALIGLSATVTPLVEPAFGEETRKAERGLPVGAAIPGITGTTQSGAPATFDSLKGDKGLVLAFVRSADWCPFCKTQLRDLGTVSDELAARGYPVVALSYDSVDKLKTFSDAAKLGYVLVSDPESKIIDAFGVRNEDVRNMKRFNGIPHPAIFIIDANGVVKAKLYEERYQDRPPGKVVIATVDGLR